MSDSMPTPNLDRALCPNSLAPTLGLQRREYWDEVNLLLSQWKNVNDTLNAKDHIENIHRFREGRGTSFYECLRAHGLEWFGSRSFFNGRISANQWLWMDLALARRSGQELWNHYIITKSPEFAPLCRFFNAAVDLLQNVYTSLLVTSAQSPSHSLTATIRAAVEDCEDLSSEGTLMLLSPPHAPPAATFNTGRNDLDPAACGGRRPARGRDSGSIGTTSCTLATICT